MFESIDWDSEPLNRYAYSGFSYGGYPDSGTFHHRVGSLDLLRALRSSRQAQRPLSLAVRLPSRRALGHGREDALADAVGVYLQRLQREIDLIGCHLGQPQRVEQFHLAGANVLDADALRRLMAHLRMRFSLLDYDSGDYAIEIEQAHTSWATMGLLRELGFNHVSIGVADAESSGGGAIALQNPRQTRSLIDAARALHYRSVNIELGYGRVWQTRASFARKVAAIVELQPGRVTLFDYAEPPLRYWPQRRFSTRGLSSREDKAAMRRLGVEQLSLAGYRYIGRGLFALPEDDLAIAQENGQLRRACQGFSQHADCDQIGLGVAAISQVGDLYAQNSRDLQRYQRQLEMGQLATSRGLRCGFDDRLRRALVDSLMCNFAVDIGAIEARFGVCLRDYFASAWPLLEQMTGDGLLTLSRERIELSAIGRLSMGAVCKAFEHQLAAPSLAGLQQLER